MLIDAPTSIAARGPVNAINDGINQLKNENVK